MIDILVCSLGGIAGESSSADLPRGDIVGVVIVGCKERVGASDQEGFTCWSLLLLIGRN